jgi:hypothetical protein
MQEFAAVTDLKANGHQAVASKRYGLTRHVWSLAKLCSCCVKDGFEIADPRRRMYPSVAV